MNYIKPLRRPPKNPSSGKKMNWLGKRREAVLTEWQWHAVEEHGWGERPGSDATILLDCAGCAEHINKLKESEEWV